MFPMLAATLVLSASPQPAPAAEASSVVPTGCQSGSDEADGVGAKRLPTVAGKAPLLSAKGSTRGRAIPVGAMKAFEGVQDTGEPGSVSTIPTRDSAYVCPSDMVMIGRNYCIDVYEASLVKTGGGGSGNGNGTEEPWPFYELV